MENDITRPDPAVVEKLRALGAATVAGTLAGLGVRHYEVPGKPHFYDCGSAVVLDARHHSAPVCQDISLNYVQYGPAVDIEPGQLGSFYLLQLPLRGSAEVSCGGQHVTAGQGMASLPSPSEYLKMRWADDSPHLILRISQGAVVRQVEQLVFLQILATSNQLQVLARVLAQALHQ